MESFGRKPTIFVSSTCYDLKQVRADLKHVIEEEVGLEALLSEYESFPLDPSIGTVDNCLRVVSERADIFVLIIGSRYGFKTDSGKSVTNIEYLRAKEKGIPIYAFIDKRIISNLSFWRDNPTANFSSIVDTSDIFRFADELRSIDNVWVYEFEFAKEIAHKLKSQLSYLFYDSLIYRKRLMKGEFSNKVLQMSPDAIKLILEKPVAWEYKFFAQVLLDYMNEYKGLRRDFQYEVFLEFRPSFDDISELLNWLENKNTHLMKIADSLGNLINRALPEAFGLPGVDSDLEFLIYVAKKIADVYRHTILWELELGLINPPDEAKKLVLSLSKLSDSLIQGIESFNFQIYHELNKIPVELSNPSDIELSIILNLDYPDLSDFRTELSKIRTLYGLIEYI